MTYTRFYFFTVSPLLFQLRQLKRHGWVTLLNDDRVQTQLHLGPLHDPLLHRVFSNITKDAHLLLLANSVSSVLMGLKKKSTDKRTLSDFYGKCDL